MPETKIGLRPEDEHANGFAFTYTDRHGKITGRVSVRFSGRPDTRTLKEKADAAKAKVRALAAAFHRAAEGA